MEQCDFCSGTPVIYHYPCAQFVAWEEANLKGLSSGAWAACATCATLIDAEQWDRLALQSLSMFTKSPLTRKIRIVNMDVIREIHRRFRNSRTGPPEKVL